MWVQIPTHSVKLIGLLWAGHFQTILCYPREDKREEGENLELLGGKAG